MEHDLQVLMNEAKSSYESKLILSYAHSHSYKIFQYISSIKDKCQSNFPTVMTHNNLSASSDLDKAKLFNKYFYSVFTKDDSPPNIHDTPMPTHVLQDIEISHAEVFAILSSLDITKSAGLDDINPKILNFCAQSLLQPVCHLFNISISTSKLPIQWRSHRITPIHKSGDKSLISNYRPISLLCVLSKVLEKVMYNRIITYLENSFTAQQFGFLPRRSALQQLLLFTRSLLESKTKHEGVDIIYMDFKKAFDSVSHSRLLTKLKSIGITGKLSLWLEAYLSDCYQCVQVGNSISEFCNVLSGVPQGSILGPLLFAIYINDLPESANSSILYLFADDTKCLKSINSPEDVVKFQSDICNVSYWSSNWNLPFNDAKFVHMRFWESFHDNHSEYTINNKFIEQKSFHKDLGITFTNDLNWAKHISTICAKAYQTLGLLRRTFKTNCVEAKKQLYISLVRSQVLYCSQLWRPQLLKDIQSLERIQRRATKFILNNYSLPYKLRLEQLHLLPLMYIYVRAQRFNVFCEVSPVTSSLL